MLERTANLELIDSGPRNAKFIEPLFVRGAMDHSIVEFGVHEPRCTNRATSYLTPYSLRDFTEHIAWSAAQTAIDACGEFDELARLAEFHRQGLLAVHVLSSEQ